MSTGAQPDPLRCLALLNNLLARHGPHGFGRVMQTILGITLQDAGFDVLRNMIGVPDLVARRADRGFAIEVKTGAGSIPLSERDLEGVLRLGHTPVIAALVFPDPEPRWLLLDARTLAPGAHDKLRLARRPRVDLGFDADAGFRRTLGAQQAVAMLGTEELDRVFFERSPRP